MEPFGNNVPLIEESKESNGYPFAWKFVETSEQKKHRLLGAHTNPFNLRFYKLRTSIASHYEYLVKAVCTTCTSAAFVGMQRPHDVQVPGPTNSNIQWEVHHSRQKLKNWRELLTNMLIFYLTRCLEWRQKLQKHNKCAIFSTSEESSTPAGKKDSPVRVRPLHNSLDIDLNLHQVPKQKRSCTPLL